MFEMIITYDFIIERNQRVKGTSVEVRTGPEGEQPPYPGSQIDCDLIDVHTVRLSHGTDIKIFWANEVFGPQGNILILNERECDLALIRNCEGGTWLVRSEPTFDKRIGFTVANEKNKVLFVGIGDVIEIPGKPRQLVASFEEIYKWLAASPKTNAHTNSSVRREEGHTRTSTGS